MQNSITDVMLRKDIFPLRLLRVAMNYATSHLMMKTRLPVLDADISDIRLNRVVAPAPLNPAAAVSDERASEVLLQQQRPPAASASPVDAFSLQRQ